MSSECVSDPAASKYGEVVSHEEMYIWKEMKGKWVTVVQISSKFLKLCQVKSVCLIFFQLVKI